MPGTGCMLPPSWPQEFVLAAAYRLGLPLYRVEGPDPTCPACQQPADRYGIHAMNCGNGGERIHRRTLVVEVMHQVAAGAQLAPRKEVRFLIPGRDSRPADVLLPQWSGGWDAALEVPGMWAAHRGPWAAHRGPWAAHRWPWAAHHGP